MDVIRRNTDYALRVMVNLAARYGEGTTSARLLSEQEDVSYQLTCKLLQKLSAAGFVKSTMGPAGGYQISRPPAEITLADIVFAIQGPITINKCVLEEGTCPRKSACVISSNLIEMQQTLEGYLNSVTLQGLLDQSNDIKSKGQDND